MSSTERPHSRTPQLRGWGEFVRLLNAATKRCKMPGHYLRSNPPKMTLGKETGDNKHVVMCKPLRTRGENSKGTDFGGIKGIHTPYQLIIDDELNEMPGHPSEAPKALDAEWKKFWYVGIGNPDSWDNDLGAMAKPTGFRIEQLHDRNLEQWKIRGGVCIRLNAFNSPNIQRGQDSSGKWPYKHLPTPATIQLQREACGDSEDHPDFWQFIIALPSPDGVEATILSRPLVAQHHADTAAEWHSGWTMGASMDPAFTQGGDDCQLQFFRWGQLNSGGWAIEFVDAHVIKLRLSDTEDVHDRIARDAVAMCRERDVTASNFIYDATGPAMGLRGCFAREKFRGATALDFAGKPSKRRLSAKDKRLADQVFDRKASEIAYSLRLFTEFGQVRGLFGPNDAIIEEASRRKFGTQNRKVKVQSKKEAFNKNWSCDRFDAASMATYLMILKGFTPGGQERMNVIDQIERHDVIERAQQLPEAHVTTLPTAPLQTFDDSGW